MISSKSCNLSLEIGILGLQVGKLGLKLRVGILLCTFALLAGKSVASPPGVLSVRPLTWPAAQHLGCHLA